MDHHLDLTASACTSSSPTVTFPPEGLAAYKYRGDDYLAIANEVPGSSGTSNTTLYRLERVKPN